MAEQQALSRRQFAESGFDATGYAFNDELGDFIATIDCKRWGKNAKLVTYMTFADGRKVVAPTWRNSNYRGLVDMKVGSKIRVTYEESKRGTPGIRGVVLLEEPQIQMAMG